MLDGHNNSWNGKVHRVKHLIQGDPNRHQSVHLKQKPGCVCVWASTGYAPETDLNNLLSLVTFGV